MSAAGRGVSGDDQHPFLLTGPGWEVADQKGRRTFTVTVLNEDDYEMILCCRTGWVRLDSREDGVTFGVVRVGSPRSPAGLETPAPTS